MRKFYILDLRGCPKKPEGFEALNEVYLTDGDYDCEFDILEDMLPPDLCNRARHESSLAKEHIKYWSAVKPEALDNADFMPMGLNRGGFPPGAILREIK